MFISFNMQIINMAQIELTDQYVEKIDRLVKNGLFADREEAIKAGLETLLQLSEEDIKIIEKVQREVNSYCDIHLGNILGGGMPIRVAIKGKDYFRVPIKGEYEGKLYTYGHLFVDAESLAIDENLSDSREKIHKRAEQLTGYDGTII